MPEVTYKVKTPTNQRDFLDVAQIVYFISANESWQFPLARVQLIWERDLTKGELGGTELGNIEALTFSQKGVPHKNENAFDLPLFARKW